jgi:putative transposase
MTAMERESRTVTIGHLRTVNRRLDQSHERPVPNYDETLTIFSSFFSRRDKKELVHYRRYETRAQAVHEITAYIESFHSRQRLHSRPGYFSPAVLAKTYNAHRIAAWS